MQTFVRLKDAGASFGARALFEGLSLAIHERERVAIIGRNGAGKTTLLRVMEGSHLLETGERQVARGARLALVPQETTFPPLACVGAVVRAALEARRGDTPADLVAEQVAVARTLASLGFDDEARPVAELSGGWQKRLAIAAALVDEPDVVLLDEPTNHLDLEGILWLEELLGRHRAAFVIVSHDRVFLERVATRVVEIDPRHPGGLFSVDGAYSFFLEKREEALAGRAQARDSLDNRVRREIEWLRRGPKARATKARGRIDEAHRLIDDLARMQAEDRQARVGIDFVASGRQTRQLIRCQGVGVSLGGRRLFEGVDLLLGPKQRLGLVGTNGSGKTTLLRLLAGEIEADAGSVRRADHLRVVRFDQHRRELPPELPLKDALSPEGDTVLYRGRSLHVAGWAARFGFDPGQLIQPIGRLSGGERARVSIARLMLEPADVLLLDEPTNDLDIPTLEVLEESLVDFPGALVLVSHDRYLLDRVCTRLLSLDGLGGATFLADCAQWEEERRERARAEAAARPAPQKKPKPKSPPRPLTWKEERELEGMESAIEAAEARLASACSALEDPAVVTDAGRVEHWYREQQEAQAAVDALYARWQELEAKRDGA